MAIVQAKPETKLADSSINRQDRVDDKLMKPGKYEVSRDTVFTVTIYSKEKDGRWILMPGPGRGIETNSVVFRMWTYDEMVEMRKMSTSFDVQKRLHLIDNDALNRLKIQRLLISWTFDKDNPRLKIWHAGGVMTDESWNAFKNLQPNIANEIIDEMNKVYEFNG